VLVVLVHVEGSGLQAQGPMANAKARICVAHAPGP
jgi:hypothetical protein